MDGWKGLMEGRAGIESEQQRSPDIVGRLFELVKEDDTPSTALQREVIIQRRPFRRALVRVLGAK